MPAFPRHCEERSDAAIQEVGIFDAGRKVRAHRGQVAYTSAQR